MASVDRARSEREEKPADAVHKVLRLRKALARARGALASGEVGSSDPALAQRLLDLADEMKLWDECLEDIRLDAAELIAERDRWQIAHDKLRERLDHHSLEPRSQPERPPASTRMPMPRVARAPEESQDFTAIDKELERLNESMLRAFSSE